MKELFLLDPNIVYLNHGSFGACSKEIFEEYQNIQRELETQPVQFILQNSLEYLVQNKKALAQYIHCNHEDIFFLPNPTTAVNIIIKNLNLTKEDEVLATTHEYGAMTKIWDFYAKKMGFTYIQQKISLPIQSKESLLEEFFSGISPKTKVIFINHISSATALIFPVKEIIAKAKELDIITVIDGAHVPGHIDLNIQDLNPDFYTGTCHKWMLTPKGNSFIYVSKYFQTHFEPLIISWGYDNIESKNSFLDSNEYQGTKDISAFLATKKAIEFLHKHHWEEVLKQCRNLIKTHYEKFTQLFNAKPICPISDEFLAQMCSIPIQTKSPLELKEKLYNTYKIEIPILSIENNLYLRISLNAYNTLADLDYLYHSLIDIKNNTNLLE